VAHDRDAADRGWKLKGSRNGAAAIDVDNACAVLDGLPDLSDALARADPELRRRVFDASRLSVAIDKNAAQIHVKALVSSAFKKARDLQSLVANESIAGAGFEPATSGYEPPRLGTRVPPCSAEVQAQGRIGPQPFAFRRNTVTSPRKRMLAERLQHGARYAAAPPARRLPLRRRARRASARIACAAFRPGPPVTPPPGCAPAPQR
jgi:hypothetical protein